jgi:hypothetical protein
MKKAKVIYSESTDTLRLMPQNYLLAYREKGHWIIDPDMAVDKDLAVRVFKLVALVYNHKWVMRGEYLANIINDSTYGN